MAKTKKRRNGELFRRFDLTLFAPSSLSKKDCRAICLQAASPRKISPQKSFVILRDQFDHGL